ncbi:MAG: DUF58 domain-containing protein, partial [Dehalococcoidia bacterium]
MTLFGNRRAEELLRAPDATDSDEPGHPDPRERNRELARFVEPQQNRLLRELWVVASLLVVLIGVSAGEIVVALVGAAVFVAGWLARLWGRASLQRLQITQSLSNSHAFVGETVDYEFRIDNRKLLPLPWLELRTEMPEVLQPSNRELLLSGQPKLRWLERTTRARWYERITWTYPIPLTTRGFYKLGATRLRSGDLFGFFPRERQDRDELTLWVYPEVVPLQRLGIPIFRPHGESRGGNPLFEDPSRLQGLRDYRPGDPLKRIDWKATARRARLETRVYDPSSTPHIMLALNVATLPEAWQGYFGDVFERAVSVTASLATAYADDRFPFGLIANCTYPGRDATIRVAAGRAQGQTTRVLEALAMADVFTLVPIERLIDEEARRLPLGSTLVLVTALILPGVEDALDRLRRRGYGVAVVYVGPDDPPPTAGGAPLFDIRAQLDALQFRRVDSGYTWTRADTEFAPPDRPSETKADLPFAPVT